MLVIVGMPRSGSISLHQYLINKYGDNNVKRDECMFRDNAIVYFKQRWGNMATPVIIFRNNVDRCWSWYYFLKPDMSYARFLKLQYNNIGFGELNPIKQCNMKKFIQPWLELKPQFYSFETMILDPEFPTLNEGKTPPITEAHIDYTKKLLREQL
jgi:hypothetical protein